MFLVRLATCFVCTILVVSVPCGAAKTIPCDTPHFGLSPYTWKCTGTGSNARAEATFPGAYLRTMTTGTTSIGLVIDGTANDGCPTPSMPVIEWSIDDGPFTVVPLTQTGSVYTLPLMDGLKPTEPHKVEVYFRAADLAQNRWTASTAHLRIAGLALDEEASLIARPKHAKTAIAFGDSITEGVGVDGHFTSWQKLDANNARGTWVGFLCEAIDCEYGQFGSGGQGMANAGMAVPPLPQTWDRYDPGTSRLKNGRLLPEPDYVFCNMGTNDYKGPIEKEYLHWVKAVRKACPRSRIFCIVPPMGLHRDEIRRVVETRRKAGDRGIHFVEVPVMLTLAPNIPGKITKASFDSGHPTLYGQAIFGACLAAKVQTILDEAK